MGLPASLQKLIEDQTLEVHDASMSDDPTVASKGRLVKIFLPVLYEWQEKEIFTYHQSPQPGILSLSRDLMFSTLREVPKRLRGEIINKLISDLQKVRDF